MFFWSFPHIECKWVASSFRYDPYSWQCELFKMQNAVLVWFMWFPCIVELSCTTQTLPCSAHISQAGSLRDHSACQGCCSYLSLPDRTEVPAPLHPPRPFERVRSVCGAQVCPGQKTQWCAYVFVQVYPLVLCTVACWKVRVYALLL